MRDFFKKIPAAMLLALLVVSIMLGALAAGGIISPALNIIAKDLTLTKSALAGSDICFSAEDFDRAVGGEETGEITILSLPPLSSGKLMLGDAEIMKNQTVSRNDISSLRFVPYGSDPASCSFRFRAGNDFLYDVECTMYMLAETNYAPTLDMVSESCLKACATEDITYSGSLKASDPENDSMTYIITDYPEHGVLVMNDKMYGSYTYTPASGYTGTDRFSYMVSDQYGNLSSEAVVEIRVDANSSGTVYSDMSGHWAENAAVQLANNNIMVGQRVGNEFVFEPEEPVSRCEFLVMAMNTAGYNITSSAINTGFDDDDDIPQAYKSYVAAASSLGIINGIETESGTCFCPNNQITRAEAAVILNRMLDAKQPVLVPVFSDQSSIPAWAVESFYSLNNAGIMNGTGGGSMSAYTPLDRAQTAQILLGVINYNSK